MNLFGRGPRDGDPRPNRLRDEKSPYLRQHAANPVDWYPWAEEAFAQAKAEGKPVFLSIGYATCHWCHAMARESFADENAAALLNRFFICVKVDREERPDIDGIDMRVCQLMTGSGGWSLPPFLRGMTPRGGRATAYLCQNFSCRAPVTTAQEFKALLASLGTGVRQDGGWSALPKGSGTGFLRGYGRWPL